jgi:chemotaxis signal transduction protein
VLPAPLFVIKKCCWSPRHLDDGDGKHFGILVDALGDVLKVPPTDIAELAKVYVGVAPVLVSVIKTPPREGAPLVVLLSVESMVEQFRQ